MESLWEKAILGLGPVGVLAVVAIYLLVKYTQQKKDDSASRAEARQNEFMDQVLERLENVEELNSNLRERVTCLERENTHLKETIRLLEGSQMDLPVPAWFKDREGRLLSMNKACEVTFFLPHGYKAKDVVGRRGDEIWSEGTNDYFVAVDEIVMLTREPQVFIAVLNGVRGEERWKVLKYPRLAGNVVVGVAGIAIPEEEDEQEITYSKRKLDSRANQAS
jgi:hypothetical protein